MRSAGTAPWSVRPEACLLQSSAVMSACWPSAALRVSNCGAVCSVQAAQRTHLDWSRARAAARHRQFTRSSRLLYLPVWCMTRLVEQL